MKYLICILFTGYCTFANGQVNTLFFGAKWSETGSMKNSLSSLMKGYSIEADHTNSKTRMILFSSGSNASKSAIEVMLERRSANNYDYIGEVQLCGDFTVLLKIYKQYLDGNETRQKGGCYAEKTVQQGSRVGRVSFCPVNEKSNTWLLAVSDKNY
jgi:hypothetical protein